MIDRLFAVLERFASFTDEEKKIISDCVSYTNLNPGDDFLKVNTVADKIGFVLSGILRFYYTDKSGNEITSHFTMGGQLITDIESYFKETKAQLTVQAETRCELIIISREAYQKFEKTIPNWHNAIIGYTNERLLVANGFQRELINASAKDSYKNLSNHYPDLVNKVPLGHVASYLGITQSTLSRIRNQIVKE